MKALRYWLLRKLAGHTFAVMEVADWSIKPKISYSDGLVIHYPPTATGYSNTRGYRIQDGVLSEMPTSTETS